ncbi:ATP-binding cassette subfamily C protein [Allocatelliglobosispora scoriae]|uniref:ATP-binding cassette subfamily C protein n=1 Tax=Allocatelliglobosispora scoriae TaxID=643052 RepID=A0A841BNK3_9ACTN|nr:ABC transporter ATP-binding protein [Allocatelliglobosispora scoriae]MBB5868322.1 ATP-binding cassette subfamily C protein [Allocatelliglobosispora scoriae]
MRQTLPVASGRRTAAVLRELLRPRRGLAVGAFALLIAGTTAGLLAPPLIGHIVDVVVDRRGADAITVPFLLLIAVALAEAALAAGGVAQLAKLGESTLADLRERFVSRALRLPLEQLERAGTGDVTSRVTNDVTVIAEAARSAVPNLARALLTIGLTMLGMAALDWRFLLAALVAVPVQLHTVRWYSRRAVPLYAAQRIAVAEQQHDMLGTVGGAATVRAFRLTGDHLHRVERRSLRAVDLLMQGIRLQTRFYSRLHVGEYLGLAAVLVTGFLLVRADQISVGTATAAALFFLSLFGPINTALALIDDAQAAGAGLTRLVGVADLPEIPAPRTASAPADASITATDLWYEYVPGRTVLRGVGVEVRPGERVALVGASGAGKTTLAKLIAGVHRPTSGTVTLGGGSAVLITQEVHVFAGTLGDDLRLARPDATDAELLAALETVSWEELPDGLDTEVGEGGHSLTVAQAQQLAFARLVLADPRIVVLDEATAEAGSAGARVLERVAEAALAGRTALIVAHRLTQAAAADRIVVLEDGQVVEVGTHAELIRGEGRYAALWSAWSTQRTP